jgi:hypothetical protein
MRWAPAQPAGPRLLHLHLAVLSGQKVIILGTSLDEIVCSQINLPLELWTRHMVRITVFG